MSVGLTYLTGRRTRGGAKAANAGATAAPFARASLPFSLATSFSLYLLLPPYPPPPPRPPPSCPYPVNSVHSTFSLPQKNISCEVSVYSSIMCVFVWVSVCFLHICVSGMDTEASGDAGGGGSSGRGVAFHQEDALIYRALLSVPPAQCTRVCVVGGVCLGGLFSSYL